MRPIICHAMGRDIMAFRKDKQEVLNYLKVLKNLGHLASGSDIAEGNILEIHRMLTVDTLIIHRTAAVIGTAMWLSPTA